MKRLILFVSIFGVGLLALVLLLGPDRLWRRTKTKTIRAEELPAAPSALSLGDQGRKFDIGMRGNFTIPLGWKQVPQPDGSVLRIKTAQLKGADSEPFAGGIHLVRPVLEVYPGEDANEKVLHRISAASGDLETTRDLRSFAENRPDKGDVGRLVLGPDVQIETFDKEGRPVLTITTAQLEIPKPPPGHEDEGPKFPRLVGEKPVRIVSQGATADDSGIVLTAAGFELLRFANHLELTGPIALDRGGLSATCDGNLTFDPRDPDPGVKLSPPPSSTSKGPTPELGPGTLVLRNNVHLRDVDPATGAEQWVRTDFVSIDFEHAKATDPPDAAAAPIADVAKRMKITRIDAGGPDSTVAFGLLGGEGTARHLSRGAGDVITLDGPLKIDGLQVGGGDVARGASRQTLSLRAQERLTIEPIPVAVDAPPRWRTKLVGAAHATSAGPEAGGSLDADAEMLTAELVGRAAPATKGGAPEKGDAAGGGFDLDSLDLSGNAHIDLHERGNATARKIELRDRGQKAHLDGDAVVVTERGTLHGPTIDLEMTDASAAKVNVTVPRLTGGEIALPAGTALFGATASTTDAPLRLRLEPFDPAAPPRLEIVGEALHLRGRTIVHVFETTKADGGASATAAAARDLLRLEADSLDLISGKDGAPQLVADGHVDATDFEHGDPAVRGPHRHLLAAHAHTELDADGRRHLLLDGDADAPAKGTIPVPLTDATTGGATGEVAELTIAAAHLDFDLETKRIVADDPVNLVTAWIPESLVAPALPPGFGALGSSRKSAPAGERLAALEPLRFQAEHVEITPQGANAVRRGAVELLKGVAADSPFARARVNASGRVHAERPSDRTSFDALTMALNLARSEARIAGSAADPVHLRRNPLALADAAAKDDRLDEIVTEWIDVSQTRDGKPRVQLAARRDGPIIVLHPERTTDDGTPSRRLRVAMSCPDPLELVDRRLLLTGGVETWIDNGEPSDLDFAQAHIRSERVELTLNRGIGERAAGDGDLAIERLSAQGRVHVDYIVGLNAPEGGRVDHRECHAEGALLTYEFASSTLVLKQGAERCRLLAADLTSQWRSVADFEQMTIEPLFVVFAAISGGRNRSDGAVKSGSDKPLKVSASFKDFHLLAEGVRGR